MARSVSIPRYQPGANSEPEGASRTARRSTILLVVLLAAACSDGRSSFDPPHIVTFNPGTGRVFSIQVTPKDNPRVRDDLDVGLGLDGWNLTPEGRFGLIFDAATNRLVQVDFRGFDDVREIRTFLNVATFPIGGVAFGPGERIAILREGAFQTLKILDFVRRDAPVLSGELSPPEPVQQLTFARNGRYALLEFSSRFDQAGILEFSALDDPLLLFDLDVAGRLLQIRFLELAPGSFVAIEDGTGRLRTLRFVDRATTQSLELGEIDLGDTTLARFAAFHQRRRVVVTGGTTAAYLVDLENLAQPALVARFDLSFPVDDAIVAVSPDDRFLAVGGRATGTVQIFNLDVPEVPLLTGSFSVGAAIDRMQFSSEDDLRAFGKAPSLMVVAAGSISLFDLRDPVRPVRGSPVGFPLVDFDTFRMRNRLLLSGLDDAGQVVTFDLSDPEQAESVGTFDLGVGGGLSTTVLIER